MAQITAHGLVNPQTNVTLLPTRGTLQQLTASRYRVGIYSPRRGQRHVRSVRINAHAANTTTPIRLCFDARRPRDRKFLSFNSRLTRCSAAYWPTGYWCGLARVRPSLESGESGGQQSLFRNKESRTPISDPAAAATSAPRTVGGCRHKTQEAAERAAALGGPRGDRASAVARCLRIASTTS